MGNGPRKRQSNLSRRSKRTVMVKPHCFSVMDGNLRYDQIIKHKQGCHLVDIEKRVIRGTEEEILAIIRTEQRGQTINTSYVESRNGNYRKDNKRLARRSACQSKEVTLHDAHID